MPKAKVEQLDMLAGVAAPPGKVVEEAQRIWNEHAALYKWKKCQVLDKARQASIKRAVGDYGGLTGWRDSLASVAKNRFVQGMIAPREGYKQFVANIDWFCRPVTVRKVLEEFYEDEGADRQASGQSMGSIAAETEPAKWGRYLKDYKPGRFWASSLGPRPEDAACRAPADLLKWWREQHGVVVAAAGRETKEERLRGMVATFRKIGQWDKANKHEMELAALEGRPAVLVAAPDVAGLTGAGSDRRSHREARARPIFDGETGKPYSREQTQRAATALQSDEPPPWNPDEVPEAEYETIGPE